HPFASGVNNSSSCSKFIHIMIALRELNEFNALFAIIYAFGSSAIHRLRLTLSGIPQQDLDVLKEMQQLVAQPGNYPLYRRALERVIGPAIPYMCDFLAHYALSYS